jgi:type IV pilus assembly protein PilY1
MPHALLTAPTTMPGQWMLGFEDLPGGGDRDFNDAVFLFQGSAGSTARSAPLTTPGSGCAVSRVRFTKTDFMPAGCDSQPAPSYEVAPDCWRCLLGVCSYNPTPTWYPVPLGRGTGTAVLDVAGTLNNHLCWKVTHMGGSPACLPSVTQVDVGYALTQLAP